MKKFFIKFLIIFFFSNYFVRTEEIKAFIPYYYFPTTKNLDRESLIIGKSAYQFLYFGQIKESLNLAKLAVKINKKDEKLWFLDYVRIYDPYKRFNTRSSLQVTLWTMR